MHNISLVFENIFQSSVPFFKHNINLCFIHISKASQILQAIRKIETPVPKKVEIKGKSIPFKWTSIAHRFLKIVTWFSHKVLFSDYKWTVSILQF